MAEVVDGRTIGSKRRFTRSDLDVLAQDVMDQLSSRKSTKARKERERVWKEVDRQLRMEPDRSHKVYPEGHRLSGYPIPERRWRSELELPLQSQTLEVLMADARRLMERPNGPHFAANAEVTDEFLRRVDFSAIITGDENDVPSRVTQENVNHLVRGWLTFIHRQYDYWGHWDLIDAEAFKYGNGVARVRPVTKQVVIESADGVLRRDAEIPVLFPRSIKNTYLDESESKTLNKGFMSGPVQIEESNARYPDLIKASQRGSRGLMAGGWMPEQVRKVEPDADGMVTLVEAEGDFLVPRKTVRPVEINNVIITVACGLGDPRVIRMRERRFPFSSYLNVPYHREDVNSPYGVGPLMKGMPIQLAATTQLNLLIDAGVLNVRPPIQYDPDEAAFAATGGPKIEPEKLWPTLGTAAPVQIGRPEILQQTYVALVQQYFDVTGTNPGRLGAQTVSHTTAFAKNVEIQRGTIRTVDYVQATQQGPMQRSLQMEYQIGREIMGNRTDPTYIADYGGFVDVSRAVLPERVVFDVLGPATPQEDLSELQQKFIALQTATQLELQKRQAGIQPHLNLNAVQEQVLRDGGIFDIDQFIFQPEQPRPPATTGQDRLSTGLVGSADQITALLEAGVG